MLDTHSGFSYYIAYKYFNKFAFCSFLFEESLSEHILYLEAAGRTNVSNEGRDVQQTEY